MKRWWLVLVVAAAGCDPGPIPPTPIGGKSEPDHLRVLHVLIAFSGSANAAPTVVRSRDEAEILARQILARARRGEDFRQLMKDFSNDNPTGGDYRLANYKVRAAMGETPRENFVPGFTKVAFGLKVDEIGLAPYDVSNTPHGYHVIKRIE